MKFKKIILSMFCLALTIFLIAGCGQSDNKTTSSSAKNQLVFASTKDIRNINPHLYSGEMSAQNMVFESLTLNTPEGVKPHLAENWKISDDGREYTFYLRKDVSFTDGEKFNAAAVKLNIEAVLDNLNRHAWLELVRQIDKVEALDEYTVKLTLKSSYYPTLVELGLTRPFRFISPKCFVDSKTKDGVNGYHGTGPWVLKEHVKDQYALFSVNEKYWGKRQAIDSVLWKVIPDHQTILLALQKGEVDLIFGADGDMLDLDSFQALEKQGKYVAALSKPIASRAILINSKRPIINDLKVRQALEYAVDKESIASGILNGTETVASSLMSRTVPYCDIDLPAYNFNLEKTNELLEQAGWTRPAGKEFREKDGQVLKLTFYYNNNNAQERTIAEFIQSDFKKAGIDLKMVGEEKQAFLDRQRTGEFDLQYSLSWGTPYDPQSYVSSFRIPAHGDYQAQLGLPAKAELDKTIDAVLTELDEGKRKELYAKIFTTLHNECVYIPLSYSRTKAVHSPRLKGVVFNESQYEIPFEKMHFSQ